MRTALAHGLAILAMLPVLLLAFILMLADGKFNEESFGFALIYMMFFGPVVLIATLIYYAIFRAHRQALLGLALAGVAIQIGLQLTFVVDFFGIWLLVFLAGLVAAVTHHIVIRLVQGRGIFAQP